MNLDTLFTTEEKIDFLAQRHLVFRLETEVRRQFTLAQHARLAAGNHIPDSEQENYNFTARVAYLAEDLDFNDPLTPLKGIFGHPDVEVNRIFRDQMKKAILKMALRAL